MKMGGTEKTVFIQFDKGLHAFNPLASPEKLGNHNLPFPISIVFGK